MKNQQNHFSLAKLKRQSRGMTLEQIARETRISVLYLRALEQCRFDVLPGGIYNISYIRQYASAVGSDEWDLLHYCLSQVQDSDPESPGRRSCGRRLAAKLLNGYEDAATALKDMRFRFLRGSTRS